MNYTLNCNGRLLSLEEPCVMGILNVTPDSFYAQSRVQTERDIVLRAQQILDEGGSIIDVGACSTRPDSTPASQEEEMERLRLALGTVRREMPDAIISVDTFRPDVARMAVEEYGADIINDVGSTSPSPSQGGGQGSSPWGRLGEVVARRLGVPYIYMSRKATMTEVLMDCAEVVDTLRSMGQKDIILDQGFGFGKTVAESGKDDRIGTNYEVLNQLERMQMLRLPILVGVSRKSMIYRLLGTEPAEALNGTTVLNTIALMKGASILRVHDVREAVECVKLNLPQPLPRRGEPADRVTRKEENK
jgi:dihydropteroate synthase